ncbi:MAG: TRAP transporter large permease [Lachnospiraceae bacterium]|nr:TRAP transporter large permease [Lachnospiraceae bacterium]
MSVSMIVVIVTFLVLMLLGFPVLFALGIPGLVWLGMNSKMPVTILSQNMMAYLNSFTLLCLPGFMLVGRLMNTCGVTDRLFNLSLALVGRFRGGMAYANCVASAMFASMSGSAIADAGGLGLVEMKMMKQAGYEPEYAAGVTVASSIIGPIIPPSAAMVLLGAISQISVASMFFGGVVPGVLLCGALCVQVFIIAHFTEKGKKMPCSPIPVKQALLTIPQAFPALLTFIIILGSILSGICTTTEAAVIAVWYSIFLGICYKKVTLKNLWETCKDTAEACGPLFIIMTSASMFSWIITREGLPQMIATGMQSIAEHSSVLVVIFICVLIFLVIGCFMDTTAAVLLLAPIIMPVVKGMGIDPIYFGVLMILGLMVGIITPPFGICLFVVSGVAKLPVKAVTKEAVKYIPAMVAVILLIMFFPQIVLFLPNVLFGK